MDLNKHLQRKYRNGHYTLTKMFKTFIIRDMQIKTTVYKKKTCTQMFVACYSQQPKGRNNSIPIN